MDRRVCRLWPKSIALALAAFLILPAAAYCQSRNKTPLWPLAAPLANGANPEEDMPWIFLYLPSSHRPTPGIVVCPSGDYIALSMDRDGRQVAEWLNGLGIAAFVLQYRLAPAYRYPVPLLDAQRALRYVRYNASLYNLIPNRIGIMGFAAGGHLAAMAATHLEAGQSPPSDAVDRVSARPDFLVLVYPVISCSQPPLNSLVCSNLLGAHPAAPEMDAASSEKHVAPQTPPTFIFHTYDDVSIPVEHSLSFFAALRKAGVPAELHVYQHGPFEQALAQDDPFLSTWPKLLENWFRVRGLLPPKITP